MIKSLVLLVFLLYSGLSYSNILDPNWKSDYIELAKSRCAQFKTNKINYITAQDHKWGLSFTDLFNLSRKLYRSKKQLFDKVYYDPRRQSFILPVREDQNLIQNVKLPESFIYNLILHIETALEKNYADEINFSDMGHSHFLIPKSGYKKNTEGVSRASHYENILKSKETLFVYHTAEQLDMKVKKRNGLFTLPKDKYLRHRYLTRNLIAYNDGSRKLDCVQVNNLETEYNTFRNNGQHPKYSNYEWHGAGYFMHANHQGCFPFKKEGAFYYFDISLEGPHSIYTYE